jgi:hypothetical protein
MDSLNDNEKRLNGLTVYHTKLYYQGFYTREEYRFVINKLYGSINS